MTICWLILLFADKNVSMARKFNILLSSDFEQAWRYNIDLVCETLDAAGNRTAFLTEAIHLAEVGDNLSEPPVGWSKGTRLEIQTEECESVRILGYVVAHSMIKHRGVDSVKPFDITLKVTADGKKIYEKSHPVDQRGGTAIGIEL